MSRIRAFARMSLGTLLVPVTGAGLLHGSPAQATSGEDVEGAIADPGTDPADIDLGSLGSCTAMFGLTKQNSRYISFDVQGSLAGRAAPGEDIIPVFEFVNPSTSEFDHCIMTEAWDPEVPVWDLTDSDDLDFVTGTPADLTFGMLNEGTIEEFFLGSSEAADDVLRVEGLFDPGTKKQFLIPIDVPGQFQPAVPLEETERVFLVPAPGSGLDTGDLSYDSVLPLNTSNYQEDGQVANLEMLATGIDFVRNLLASASSNDADVLAEFDALMADLIASGPGNCSQEPTEEFLFQAVRATANPAFFQALIDDNALIDYISYDAPPVDYCQEVQAMVILAGFAAEVTDSRVMPVTAGVLPATGTGAAEMSMLAAVALAAGTALLVARRRRSSLA